MAELKKSEMYKLTGSLLAASAIALTALGSVSWKFLAAGILVWPAILIAFWAAKREESREASKGVPRRELDSEFRPRPEDGPR